jgi:beta-mannosidase
MAMLAGVSLNSLGEVLKAALVLPVPRIDTQITPSGSGYEVTLKSPTLARSVYLSFGGQDATYSDNYFDLLRGSPLLIHLDSKTSLETLRTAMQVKSLATSFKQSQTQ